MIENKLKHGLIEFDLTRLTTVLVYHHCGKNVSQAAEMLGISRTTMRDRVKANYPPTPGFRDEAIGLLGSLDTMLTAARDDGAF